MIDLTKPIEEAATRVLANAIQQVASVLVPAVVQATKQAANGISVSVTVGPITIEPIKITVGMEQL